MKKRMQILVAFLLVSMLMAPMMRPVAFADQATSYTYTLDENYEYVRTQDAYLPDRTLTELGLNSPADLFIDGKDRIFIADSGNRRVIVYDIASGEVIEDLNYAEFSSPAGVGMAPVPAMLLS